MIKLAAVAIWSGLFLLWCLEGPPSDDVMIRNLQRNQSSFAELLGMIREDPGLVRVDVDWTEPDDATKIGVSAERIARYRLLLEKTGVAHGFYSFQPSPRVLFVVYASGLSIRGAMKSYFYGADPPESLTGRPLDEYHQARKVELTRHVGGDWYLCWSRS